MISKENLARLDKWAAAVRMAWEPPEAKLGEIPDFNPFPPEFKYDASFGYCNVIVHPGYSFIHEPPTPDKYGSYPDYLENLGCLLAHLKESGELTVLAIEEAANFKAKCEVGLLMPPSALVLITIDSLGVIPKYVKTPEGNRRQKPEAIFSFLEREGITEARFAGEWAWWEGIGCLRGVANDFHKAGFETKGIEGCIYPSVPPEETDEILERIYSVTVEILSPLAVEEKSP